MLSYKNRVDWVRLARSENIGPRTFQTLIDLYGSADNALKVAPEMSIKGGRKKPIRLCSEADAKKEIELTEKMGAKLVLSCDSDYPALLKHVKDYPPVITVFGDSAVLNKNIIAIVGARNASANGCRFANSLAHDLGHRRIIVASGLARGIDTSAHNGSLATGTIAIVAGGIDKIYPLENTDLFYKIRENGAVVTEMPFGAIPKSQNFPRRNRIISGLSLGIIVVEANLKSGSLITARMALEQDREVFAVPGSPLDPRCKGTNSLIRQGATMVESIDDVMEVMESIIASRDNLFLFEKEGHGFAESQAKSVSENELSGARPLVMEKLGCSPTPVDDIISQTGLTPNVVLTILLELELAGNLNRHAGNRVSLVFGEEDLFIANG